MGVARYYWQGQSIRLYLKKQHMAQKKMRIWMNEDGTTDGYEQIVIDNVPLIDVRAPVEFAAGAFPTATNIPILDDEDRHLVGKCYKRDGREAAFNLAFKRVSGQIKENRIKGWAKFRHRNSSSLLALICELNRSEWIRSAKWGEF